MYFFQNILGELLPNLARNPSIMHEGSNNPIVEVGKVVPKTSDPIMIPTNEINKNKKKSPKKKNKKWHGKSLLNLIAEVLLPTVM